MATYDREKLIDGLNNLTGFDFTKAELRVRREGDMTPDVTFSKRFQAEVAAIALKESAKVLMTMPISEFTEMCAEVSVFLLRGSVEKMGLLPGNNAEELPSDLESAEAQTFGCLPQSLKQQIGQTIQNLFLKMKSA